MRDACSFVEEVVELHDAALTEALGSRHRRDGHIGLDDDGRTVIDLTGRRIFTRTRAVEGVVDDGIRRRTAKTDLRTLIDQDA